MNTSIRFAYHSVLKKIIHIDKADNGKKCKCECFECGEELQARQGKIRDWHFKHHNNPDCSGSQETALHLLGKQILIDKSSIKIPKYGTISYSNPIAEKTLKTKRPDVTATYNNEQIFLEIVVSNPVNYEKEKMFIDGQHKSIEINLSKHRNSSFEEIEKTIIEDTENKRIIYWEAEEVLKIVNLPITNTQISCSEAEVEVFETQQSLNVYTQKIKEKTFEWTEQLAQLVLGFVIICFLGLVLLPTKNRSK